MAGFKEIKKINIEKGKEKGDAGIAKGEQRVQELQIVKEKIDQMHFQDQIDEEHAQVLKESYKREGKEAYDREVKSVVESVKNDLELNKGEISKEREKVESGIAKVGDMKGATDLARNAASRVEGNLKKSADEYRQMETDTDKIKVEQEQKSRNILSRIENMFG